MEFGDLRALRALLLLGLGVGCLSGEKETGGGDDSSVATACTGSTPILDASGAATGYERCDDGTIHRVSAVAVSSEIPGESCSGTEEYLSCTTDADCAGGPGSTARCLHEDHVDLGGRASSPPSDGCSCAYSCGSDADCDAGMACVPVDIVTKDQSWSTCAYAGCAADADCAGGECGITSFDDGCGYDVELACRSDADSCRVDADCETDHPCAASYYADGFSCQTTTCAIGRPLSVDGQARVASAASRSDWSGQIPALDLSDLSEEQRWSLSAWWREVAALEHASVASFARFSLDLLALGAPPELLAEAARAGADEIRHARLAYGLAGAFAGEVVGPGPLDLSGVRIGASTAEILVALIHEAAVGETLGAAEARAAAQGAHDPELRAALLSVAEDEARHAALAWRALRWMLERDPSLHDLAGETFAIATEAVLTQAAAPSPHAPELGVLGPEARRSLHRAALDQVVRPCLEALLGG